jgi:hypothetical protein
VLVVVVLGVKELLNLLDGEMDNDPVLSGAVVHVLGVDAILLEPLMNKIVSLRSRRNQLIDLISAEVLTVTRVVRVGDLGQLARIVRKKPGIAQPTFIEMTVKLLEATLLQTNLKLDRLSSMGTLCPGPFLGHEVCLLDGVRRARHRRGERVAESENGRSQYSGFDLHSESGNERSWRQEQKHARSLSRR